MSLFYSGGPDYNNIKITLVVGIVFTRCWFVDRNGIIPGWIWLKVVRLCSGARSEAIKDVVRAVHVKALLLT